MRFIRALLVAARMRTHLARTETCESPATTMARITGATAGEVDRRRATRTRARGGWPRRWPRRGAGPVLIDQRHPENGHTRTAQAKQMPHLIRVLIDAATGRRAAPRLRRAGARGVRMGNLTRRPATLPRGAP